MPRYRNISPTAIRVIPLGVTIEPGDEATLDVALPLDGLVVVPDPAPDEEEP